MKVTRLVKGDFSITGPTKAMKYTLPILLLTILPTWGNSYSTMFKASENPISENGRWINGATTGFDWGNVRTNGAQAYGTTISGAPPFDDSTAILTGTWAMNQTAQAAVRTVNQSSAIQEEVELRLNSTVTAHGSTGYEADYRVTADGSQYIVIVRWNGPLNDFTYLTPSPCTTCGPGLRDGDTIKFTNMNGLLTLYINNVAYLSATDHTFTGGAPGIGFWMRGGTTEQLADYGLTSFSATDSMTEVK